jgi:hypothetical protein
MPSPFSREIRGHLAGYLTGQSSLDEFMDWLVGETWDIEERHDAEAEDLTYEIKLALAEPSDGYITADEAQEARRPLVAVVPAPTPV